VGRLRLVRAIVAAGLLATAGESRGDERVDVTAMDGVQLIAELGGTRGPGIVIVHDAGDDRGNWRALAEVVAARGFRVLRVDLRGHGESDGTADAGTADRDVEGAYRYLLGRKIRPVFLVAADATRPAALAVAARVPTAGVVLIGSSGSVSDPSPATLHVLRLDEVTTREAQERLGAWLSDASAVER
jgi:pimeloyl-ACP methyl ester carboxylesterase